MAGRVAGWRIGRVPGGGWPRLCRVRLVASVESKNLLFLKKKKQKDFAGLRPRRAERYRKQAKVFGSFFQKRTAAS
jgi:hypothetical protein